MLFVNVPIGLARRGSGPARAARDGAPAGRFDLPGAITGTAGVAASVYGLSNAATSPNGVSHWGDAKVIASLTAAAVLLAAFALIEVRSSAPAAADPGAAQPGPVRCVPDQPVRRHRAASACSSS